LDFDLCFFNRLADGALTMPAEIIPFKPRPPRPDAEPDNRTRLRDALARLDAANRRQKESVAKWRQALTELRTSMQALDNSMERTSLRLSALRSGVDAVRDESRRLEQRMDQTVKRD